ncbi:hypothetical protein EVAR_49057_1 [Eumeta japonica]|uniref:Uncharacterized protein n=1 Tax=Eumeta variegata TaxID=151549 RepID=A0A4C1Y659_EUMVA|nr:hypothetical protein EVAR_49057_1 [Eumeta japonica]
MVTRINDVTCRIEHSPKETKKSVNVDRLAKYSEVGGCGTHLESSQDTSVNTQTQNEDTTEFEPKSSQAGSEKQSTSIAENSRNGGTISSTSLHSGKPVNRKRKTDIPIDMAIKELKAISKENKEQVEDEFDLFCKSLAIQLKKMP